MLYQVVTNKGWKSEPFWADNTESSKEIAVNLSKEIDDTGYCIVPLVNNPEVKEHGDTIHFMQDGHTLFQLSLMDSMKLVEGVNSIYQDKLLSYLIPKK